MNAREKRVNKMSEGCSLVAEYCCVIFMALKMIMVLKVMGALQSFYVHFALTFLVIFITYIIKELDNDKKDGRGNIKKKFACLLVGGRLTKGTTGWFGFKTCEQNMISNVVMHA